MLHGQYNFYMWCIILIVLYGLFRLISYLLRKIKPYAEKIKGLIREKFQMSLLNILKENKDFHNEMFKLICKDKCYRTKIEIMKKNLVDVDPSVLYSLAVGLFDDDLFYVVADDHIPSREHVDLAFQLQNQKAMEEFLKEGHVARYDINLNEYICDNSPGKSSKFLEMCKNYHHEIKTCREYDFEYGRMTLSDYAFLSAKWNVIFALHKYDFETQLLLDKLSRKFLDELLEEDDKKWKESRFLIYLITMIKKFNSTVKYWPMNNRAIEIIENSEKSKQVWNDVMNNCFGKTNYNYKKIFDSFPLAKAISILFQHGLFDISYDDNYCLNKKDNATIYAPRFLHQTEKFQIEILSIINKNQVFLKKMLDNAKQKNYSLLVKKITELP